MTAQLDLKTIQNWQIGTTSIIYETGGKGVATISSGNGDNGGVSYGAYQLSSTMGTLSKYLNSAEFGNYGQYFIGLIPGTQLFNNNWISLANNDPKFALSQHDFIASTHYNVMLENLSSSSMSMNGRGIAVQDMIWSTSVQFGPNSSLIKNAILSKFGVGVNVSSISDNDIITAVQDYKIQNNNNLFQNSSNAVKLSTLARASAEKSSLLSLNQIEINAKSGTTTFLISKITQPNVII